MDRRRFLALTSAWASSAALDGFDRLPQGPQGVPGADVVLNISEINWELAPKTVVRTTAYNGQVPGPLIRARTGKPLTIDVVNETKAEEVAHWHGLHIPPDVDGSIEEGTPPVPPNGGRRRYTFTPEPAGTRWYHSHVTAGRNLKRGTYTGQFGIFLIDDGRDPGAYDQEVPLLLHEFEPRFTREGPLDVEFKFFSINGRMSGAGEPVRVRRSQRVLFRIVNASATLHHRLALPRHEFLVTALDGNPVPHPKPVSVVEVSPGERVDAVVEMNQPGVWILGETNQGQRVGGMGILVEYADATGAPRWEQPRASTWDYGLFANDSPLSEPDARTTLIFRATEDGHHWLINGKSHPNADPIVVQHDKRYRLLFDNQSANDHPIHLHRHTFEVVRVADRLMSGILKDVVVVPAWRQVEVDVPTVHPGLSLFHCHQQFHMDMGFMTMMRYAPHF
jgi:FtsP/CotA-like multicopper oxidase with cupredoxin domain